MAKYVETLTRWLLAPVVLIIIAVGLYFFFRLIGWKKKQAMGLSFISPWLVGFVAFTGIPIFASLYYSFTDFNLFNSPKWVGLENFRTLFAKDVYFWPSVKITLLYALITVPIGVVGSLLAALLLSRDLKSIGLFRTIFYLTAILPEAAVALIWRWLFNSETGLINYATSPLRSLLGMGKIDWFGDPRFVLPAFVIMSVWGIFGSNAVIFLAGLKGIPRSLYEVAEIDGASIFSKFRYVTVPQVSPVILLQVVNGMIGALQMFTVAQFMRPTTGAGQFMNQLIYTKGFSQLHMGQASAVAWILFIITLLLTLLIFRSSPAWVHYETEVRN